MGNFNFVDIIILLIIILGGVIGFRDGVIKRLVAVVGMILVIVISFSFKNFLSVIFYENLPFFNFGVFKSAPILNVILYELLALLIIAALLGVIYYILLTVSGILEKVLKATVILSIPSKILGFVVGLIENYLWVCLFLFIISLPILRLKLVAESKVADYMLNNTPLISNYTGKISVLFDDISGVVYEDENISSETKNERILDVMLKHKFVTVESADKLIEKNKITVNDKSFIDKYR